MNNTDFTVLWANILNGDEFAFEQLYDHMVIPLHNVAFKIVKDGETARDILQDVFVDLFLGKEKVAADINIAGYLHNMVKYRSLNALRSQLREKTRMQALQQAIPERDEQPEPAIPAAHVQLEQLENNIAYLPEKCRKVFELKYYKNLSYKQISSELGISVKTVENHISKAFAILRHKVSDEQLLFLLLTLNAGRIAVKAWLL
ncbi:RNA polymerase sigma-70 factor [Deminuibacter soli]|uniref:RNA polymerase sigma-70 factor n=1 Tax=Deminuibacter soli TaxID=2291815 RepID=UPI001314204B|nr:RNA polymerase sigma-70 factor [Deminuibacter soli]